MSTAVIDNPNPTVLRNLRLDDLLSMLAGDSGDELLAELIEEAENGEREVGTNGTAMLYQLTRMRRDNLLITKLREIEASGVEHRRRNPKARSMRRRGRRYEIRKDHGTVARRKQIAAANAAIEDAKSSTNSVRARRRERKNEAGRGN